MNSNPVLMSLSEGLAVTAETQTPHDFIIEAASCSMGCISDLVRKLNSRIWGLLC